MHHTPPHNTIPSIVTNTIATQYQLLSSSFTSQSSDLPPPRSNKHLKPILQTLHIRVTILPHLKATGDDFHRPRLHRDIGRGFEAQVEVAGVLAVDAEGVHAAARIGFDVGF